MEPDKDILTLENIKSIVDSFYEKIQKDSLLAPIFNERIQDRWPQHLEKMYRFWQTVLLEEHTYFGSPFLPHAKLPVGHAHFKEWMRLFTETVNELFSGEKAKEAIWRAEKMAEMFELKIEYFRENPTKAIL